MDGWEHYYWIELERSGLKSLLNNLYSIVNVCIRRVGPSMIPMEVVSSGSRRLGVLISIHLLLLLLLSQFGLGKGR